eukprot:6170394-Pyramimonas_sp.AAC.1
MLPNADRIFLRRRSQARQSPRLGPYRLERLVARTGGACRDTARRPGDPSPGSRRAPWRRGLSLRGG